MKKILVVAALGILLGAGVARAGFVDGDGAAPPPYDQDPGNPPRDSLRFPDFNPSWGLTRKIYEKAVAYYEKNRTVIPNPRYFSIVDFNLHQSKKRLFLFDLSNGGVERHAVAAGKGSDADGDGYATRFSNEPGSNMSSLGFYQTLQTYSGDHGYSLRLAGLDPTNSNAEARAIVIHPAAYVSDDPTRAGQSWGCPAIDPDVSKRIIDKVRNGSMLLMDR